MDQQAIFFFRLMAHPSILLPRSIPLTMVPPNPVRCEIKDSKRFYGKSLLQLKRMVVILLFWDCQSASALPFERAANEISENRKNAAHILQESLHFISIRLNESEKINTATNVT